MEAWLHPRTTTMCLGCSEYTKATRNHLVKCSGIEAAISGLNGGLGGHHQLEQGTHTCLDVVLNDKRYIKNVEVWEEKLGRNLKKMERKILA